MSQKYYRKRHNLNGHTHKKMKKKKKEREKKNDDDNGYDVMSKENNKNTN